MFFFNFFYNMHIPAILPYFLKCVSANSAGLRKIAKGFKQLKRLSQNSLLPNSIKTYTVTLMNATHTAPICAPLILVIVHLY